MSPLYVCVFPFFLYWFLSFPCFLVGSLFLTVVGFFVRVCLFLCVLSVLGVASLVLFLRAGVCVCGGWRMCMSYVCPPLSYVCVLCVLYLCFCLHVSLVYVLLPVCVVVLLLLGVCGVLLAYVCAPYACVSCIFCVSLLSVFLCLIGFCSPGCLCVLGFCVFGVLGGCLWGVFFVFWRVSGVLFCWGGGFWG